MPRRMLVNMSDPDECRVAVVQDGELQELFIEHASSEHHVGNIYKGRIENIEPSIQAAFVDIGLERNAFLHVSDVNPDYMKGSRPPKGQLPRIQNVLRRGQEVVVQVTKSGIGTKGPALTTYLSLPGRFLVLMPNIKRHGVSRKIEDDAQRQRLKEALQQMNAPTDMGVIVRTAGDGRTKRELQRDLSYLQRLYSTIQKRIKTSGAPSLLYQESDLVTRVIRDFFTPDTEDIVVDSEPMRKKAVDFLDGVMPRYANRVKLYEGDAPLFHVYDVERHIESLYSRRVELPGGGYLIIDQAEALVAIDVNSGSYKERRDPEESAFHLNMMAAREVARQLRLRDLGGVIVIDFVDMLDPKHSRAVEKTLQDELKNDKARYRVLRMSDFGIVEMTRQRMRPSVRRAMFQECPACKGQGQIRTAESVAIAVLRLLPMALADPDTVGAEVMVSREVATHLNNAKRRDISCIEEKFKKTVTVTADPNVTTDYTRFVRYDKMDVATEWDFTCEAPAREGRAADHDRGRQPRRDQSHRGEGRRRQAREEEARRREAEAAAQESIFEATAEEPETAPTAAVVAREEAAPAGPQPEAPPAAQPGAEQPKEPAPEDKRRQEARQRRRQAQRERQRLKRQRRREEERRRKEEAARQATAAPEGAAAAVPPVETTGRADAPAPEKQAPPEAQAPSKSGESPHEEPAEGEAGRHDDSGRGEENGSQKETSHTGGHSD